MKRSSLGLDRQIYAVRHAHGHQPVCLTCGRYLDEEGLVEGEPGKTTYAKVLAKHHGQEELRTFDFGSTNWDGDDLTKFIASADWFDPRTEAGEVNIIRGND